MSSPNPARRRLLQGFAAALLLVGPTACFRPLYGPTAAGVPLQEMLSSIDVNMVEAGLDQDRLGHYLRSELIFNLNGSGKPAPKRYRLLISATENVQGTTVDVVSGRASSAILNGTARFRLQALEGTTTLFEGTSRASATYFRDAQRFANVRAARDADIRVGKALAEDIKQRLAAFFATSQ
jgi:LPS-assembly lipoprotein